MSKSELQIIKEDRVVPTFDLIRENNPSGYILRCDLKEATGGILNGRSMANLDSKGEGISEWIEIGRKRAYPVHAVIEYLQKRAIVKYCKDQKEKGA